MGVTVRGAPGHKRVHWGQGWQSVLKRGVHGMRPPQRRPEALAAAGSTTAPTPAQTAQLYDRLLAEATLADVWNADRRAEDVLHGLHLDDVPSTTRLEEISGGQRERLALAHLLIARPTTWLLDEPTNHLDDDGAAFLAAAVRAHPGPVLIASHDRAFLDDATAAQLDLDPAEAPLRTPVGGLTSYTGGFSDYLLARMDARERWEQRFRREQQRPAGSEPYSDQG